MHVEEPDEVARQSLLKPAISNSPINVHVHLVPAKLPRSTCMVRVRCLVSKYMYMHMHTHTHMHTCMHILCACARTCLCVCVYMRVCVCMYEK